MNYAAALCATQAADGGVYVKSGLAIQEADTEAEARAVVMAKFLAEADPAQGWRNHNILIKGIEEESWTNSPASTTPIPTTTTTTTCRPPKSTTTT